MRSAVFFVLLVVPALLHVVGLVGLAFLAPIFLLLASAALQSALFALLTLQTRNIYILLLSHCVDTILFKVRAKGRFLLSLCTPELIHGCLGNRYIIRG